MLHTLWRTVRRTAPSFWSEISIVDALEPTGAGLDRAIAQRRSNGRQGHIGQHAPPLGEAAGTESDIDPAGACALGYCNVNLAGRPQVHLAQLGDGKTYSGAHIEKCERWADLERPKEVRPSKGCKPADASSQSLRRKISGRHPERTPTPSRSERGIFGEDGAGGDNQRLRDRAARG